ncbi:PEP/pyruvate-binding domain-containing protein [Methylocapsa acidiphila]|uniref:PEP/pyruvate-binding domain-containing protein n=1 Tax=Methylocapsa acidiphila TaxID=133552 RepID=UPI000561BB16|nr:PEP/pyruvate-binding domain-containing protein [Methylocapsa acidiphila]
MQIVRIGDGSTERHTADHIGAKAANLAGMASLGLPVPPAFVLPVKLCAAVIEGDPHAERHLIDGLREGVAFLEGVTGKRFGDRRAPLLVSVRSGAARSMPGMLDTVLDVGCSLAAVRGLIRQTGNPRFAWDCRRRFLEGYSSVALGLDPAPFSAELTRIISAEGAENDRQLDCEALERLAMAYHDLVEDDCPSEDPEAQLLGAARAVYRSWMSERACAYRRMENLEHLRGTAVAVQAMVFGNRGLTSGAGVAFSRDPSNGAVEPVIDILFDAQGEDVVSGRVTPLTEAALVDALPAVAVDLRDILARLEREYEDVQDIEFTIENGKLWILQTRAAKRTPRAALRIAVDLVHEGLITPHEALRRLKCVNIDSIVNASLDGAGKPIARGVAASSGIAVGRAAFDTAGAERLAGAGDAVILMRPTMTTDDVAGFAVAAGILTAVGGRTAHAALVARQMGKPCIVGCAINFDASARKAQIGAAVIQEGDWLSIDGDAGAVYLGRGKIVEQRPDDELAEFARWRSGAHHRAPRSEPASNC